VDIRRALDIIYDHLELDENNEVGEAWQTLEDYCTQPTDLQQPHAVKVEDSHIPEAGTSA
jgi:hypothetical protein